MYADPHQHFRRPQPLWLLIHERTTMPNNLDTLGSSTAANLSFASSTISALIVMIVDFAVRLERPGAGLREDAADSRRHEDCYLG